MHLRRLAENKRAFITAAHAGMEQFLLQGASAPQAKLSLPSAAQQAEHGRIDGQAACTKQQRHQGGCWVYPLLQFGPWGIRHDENATVDLLASAGQGTRMYLTTAYFNLTQTYSNAIFKSKAAFSVLLASPEANRFTGAKGIMSAVPAVYAVVAERFFHAVLRLGHDGRVALWEYQREGRSFHAKGLWHCPPSSDADSAETGVVVAAAGGSGDGAHPVLTFIGSPNFGQRSSNRDLECQLAVVTDDPALRKVLHEERVDLYRHAGRVTKATFEAEDRKTRLWHRAATSLLRTFF